MPLYREGTIQALEGSTTVTGVGTQWGIENLPGDLFIIGGEYFEVLEILSDTEVVVDHPVPTAYSGEYLAIRSVGTANNLYLMMKIDKFLEDRAMTLGQLQEKIDLLDGPLSIALSEAEDRLVQI